MGAVRQSVAGERGFTLIELLAVITILGILASIAIQQYAPYKKSAIDTMMETELHHARTAMEAFYAQNSYTYTGATLADLQTYGLRQTSGVTVVILAADDTTYSLRACAPNGNFLSFRYDSTVGKLVGENVAC